MHTLRTVTSSLLNRAKLLVVMAPFVLMMMVLSTAATALTIDHNKLNLMMRYEFETYMEENAIFMTNHQFYDVLLRHGSGYSGVRLYALLLKHGHKCDGAQMKHLLPKSPG